MATLSHANTILFPFLWISAVLILNRVMTKWRIIQHLPGPSRLPLLGNFFQMPVYSPWETFQQWGNIYGDAISVSVFGRSFIILNSLKSCSDLFDKKSSIYSDRQTSIMCNQLMGWGRHAAMIQYGDIWRRYRRVYSQTLRKEGIENHFLEIQQDGVHHYLSLLLTQPDSFYEDILRITGTNLLQSAYGIRSDNNSDPMLEVLHEASEHALVALTPGRFLVDILPFLQYIPDWFPGTRWKQYAAEGRGLCDLVVDDPWTRALATMNSEAAKPSFTSINVNKGEDPDVVKYTASGMFIAGTDTTAATIRNFFLAMLLHPEAQKRAQDEIDRVVGSDRLPTIADRDHLPYINSIMKETMRWQPVVPLGLPHRVTADDVYRGCHIPKGSIVFGNTWAISRDPAVYSDPDTFNPSRFLPIFNSSQPDDQRGMSLDPDKYVYGYGRRLCAGMNYADILVFLTIANILATFDILPYEKIPDIQFISSMVREPAPFKCRIRPRSETAQSLIEEAV